jgi:hypothetical protein
MNLIQHPSQWSWSQSSRGRSYFLKRRTAPRVHFAFSMRQSAIALKLPRNYPDRARRPADGQCPLNAATGTHLRPRRSAVFSISKLAFARRAGKLAQSTDLRSQNTSSNSWHNPVPHNARIFLKTLGVMVVIPGIGADRNHKPISYLTYADMK